GGGRVAAGAKERGEAPGAKERDAGWGTKARAEAAPAGGRAEAAGGKERAADAAGKERAADAAAGPKRAGEATAAGARERDAGASPKSRRGKTARREAKSGEARAGEGRAGEGRASEAPCLRDRVELGRPTGEYDSFALLRCDGKPAEGAVERLAILLRPYSAPKPPLPTSFATERGRGEWAPGVRNADPGLLTRLQAVAERYRGKRFVIVSGYRPTSVGSYHKDARAIDLRVEGVRNEELVAFCRGLRDTGCGYYPNSSFVHFDVRPGGTGHVYWIDASAPGEAPRYVSSWPPPRDEPLLERLPKPEEGAPRDEHTHPDVANKRPGKGLGASDRSSEDGPAEASAAAEPRARTF
ncbi:MAG TPA: DUF882 domain-containing protein, partial [Polyangiaceae bacterium]|nr:DUF882 domain-containing protein [Polyangiaceae bacterium]